MGFGLISADLGCGDVVRSIMRIVQYFVAVRHQYSKFQIALCPYSVDRTGHGARSCDTRHVSGGGRAREPRSRFSVLVRGERGRDRGGARGSAHRSPDAYATSASAPPVLHRTRHPRGCAAPCTALYRTAYTPYSTDAVVAAKPTYCIHTRNII